MKDISNPIQFSVFTKPWKTTPVPELGRMVHRLGFDGVEFPVRPGFQVEAATIARDLPIAQQQLHDCGVGIFSVSTTPTPEAIRTCGKLGIPVIRVMVEIGPEGYMATERRVQTEYQALLPVLRDAGVVLGVQNHNGNFIDRNFATLAGFAGPLGTGALFNGLEKSQLEAELAGRSDPSQGGGGNPGASPGGGVSANDLGAELAAGNTTGAFSKGGKVKRESLYGPNPPGPDDGLV